MREIPPDGYIGDSVNKVTELIRRYAHVEVIREPNGCRIVPINNSEYPCGYVLVWQRDNDICYRLPTSRYPSYTNTAEPDIAVTRILAMLSPYTRPVSINRCVAKQLKNMV